ncbi:MAG: flagellar export protein FliJ [Bacillota bacterium]
MRGFKFKFAKVLRVREIKEDKALDHFRKSQRRVRKVEAELEKKENKRERIYNYIRSENDISPDFMAVVRRYLKINRKKIDELKNRLTELRKELEEKKQEYLKRRRKREIMDRLKENALEKKQKEFLDREQKELDEIGQLKREVQ